jgi:peptide/nickel transport system substrate-binding protein/oligopeptide transport system substrate-binding protein
MAALLLSACGSNDGATLNVVTIGAATAPFESSTRLSSTGQLVRAATTEGLVGFDAQGRVIPALADRWIITDDGRSYIFRLREGTWRDGSAITGESARTALRQRIAAIAGTPLALDLAGIDEIRTMAGRVLEIRLSHAMPDLLQILAQPELGLTWKGRGTGPMALLRDGDSALLTPIAPEDRGLPAIADWSAMVRALKLDALPAAAAVARFNEGEADVLLGGRIEDFPLARSVGLIRGTIQLDPAIGLFGLAVVHGDGFLSDPGNREAIAMAIDREALIAPFGVAGWSPSTRIVPGGIAGLGGAGGERWSDLDLEQRRERAAAAVARWRSASGSAPRLRIALPQGPGAETLFGQLQADLQRVGIEAVRVREGAAADLRLIDSVARYARANWFLNQLSCAAKRGLCSDGADALAIEAGRAADAATSATLLAEAEADLTAANVFIPFGAPIRWSLVRGDVTGFATNGWSIHPLMPLAMRPK